MSLNRAQSSEQNLTDADLEQTSTPKFTTRKLKRRRSESDSDVKNFISEMRQMFRDLEEKQSVTINKLCSTVEDLRSTIKFLDAKFDSLASKYEKLEKDSKEDRKYIKTLEETIERAERHSRATCLEIRNIPTQTAETKTNLVNTVINAGKALSLDLQPYEIKDVFRIKTKSPDNKTIIVDLTSVITKDKIITAVRRFNKGQNKLTTEHLRIQGPAKPVFISENLTAKMKRVFFLTRDFAKTNDYKYCWVSHGRVYLRRRDGSPLILISGESDLTNLKNQN